MRSRRSRPRPGSRAGRSRAASVLWPSVSGGERNGFSRAAVAAPTDGSLRRSSPPGRSTSRDDAVDLSCSVRAAAVVDDVDLAARVLAERADAVDRETAAGRDVGGAVLLVLSDSPRDALE